MFLDIVPHRLSDGDVACILRLLLLFRLTGEEHSLDPCGLGFTGGLSIGCDALVETAQPQLDIPAPGFQPPSLWDFQNNFTLSVYTTTGFVL